MVAENTGWRRIRSAIERVERRTSDLRELHEPFLEEFKRANRDNLLSEGGLVGGWESLTNQTLEEKARRGHGGKRIEERSGSLFRSLTDENADGFVNFVREREAAFGSSLPHALKQHYGDDDTDLPARHLIPDPDEERYEAIFRENAARIGASEGFEVIA